jgi:hypothetical protein
VGRGLTRSISAVKASSLPSAERCGRRSAYLPIPPFFENIRCLKPCALPDHAKLCAGLGKGRRMGLAVRFYLFSDDGLQRISHRLMEGLAHGKDAMPQYAGTKQKIANVIVEMENGKPVQLARLMARS